MWEGGSSQHVTSEPHIVRPWGTLHQTSWEFRVSLPAPVPIPTPCSQALQDASILPHWPPHSTALKGLCVKPRACWTKSEIALSTSRHGESNKVRAISSWILFWLSFLLFPVWNVSGLKYRLLPNFCFPTQFLAKSTVVREGG